MKPYPKYKDSGVEWLGEIPASWRVIGFKKSLQSVVDYRGKTPEKVDVGILLVTARNIKNGRIDYAASEEFVREDEYSDIMARGKLSLGDVLFTSEAPLGEVANVDRTDFALAQRVIKFSGHPQILSNYYLKYFLLSQNFQSDLYRFATGSTALGIKAERFVYLKQLLPPLSEQRAIAAYLDRETAKIDTLIAKQEQLIALLEEKRQALISHAVTKGLDPNVKMKDSGVEWLGQVPEHWAVRIIKRFLREHRQGYYTTAGYIDGGIKLMRITDLRKNNMIDFTECPRVADIPETKEFRLKRGDFVFARTGGAGSFGVVPELSEPAIYASYLIRFRFLYEEIIPDYLRYYFNSKYFEESIRANIHGGVNQNIHAEDIKFCLGLVPPKAEQIKIAAYLDERTQKFDGLTEKAKSVIEMLKEKRSSLISAAVTGKIDVRGEVA